ncbi:MAG: HutD family protein [Lachnospiraceae bacterium]|nr:HutD family protein [Lachnospiraceae bacterium]
MKHLTQEAYIISNWSGGKTVQIAIAPEGARYADRDFLWRLSSATVELEESDFTALPDYERWIAPVSGEMILTHNGGEEITLKPYDVHSFDGADDTRSRGRCTDFNLMLRKGRCGGVIRALGNGEAGQEVLIPEARTDTLIVYCTEGNVAVETGEESVFLKAGEALQLDKTEIAPLTLHFADGGRAMAAQIRPEKEE